MKICIFLIIGFTQIVFGCDLNHTQDSLPVCPFKLFRRKRELDYTRWRANLETSPEFIVKVLDEDLNTVKPKKIVAVNIQPVTKKRQKIIIGGAMVTTPSTVAKNTEETKEYTRFIPPTTTLQRNSIILAPTKSTNTDYLQQFIEMLPRGKNPQRDESPPAGPQFVSRSPQGARQYAPVTPVGFTRRPFNIISPTPTAMKEPYIQSTSFAEIKSETKTKDLMTECGNDIPTDHDSYHHFLSTASTEYVLTGTSDHFELSPSNRGSDDIEQKPTGKTNELDQKENDRDSDIQYLSLYDEDDEEDEKTSDSDGIDAYLQNIKDRKQTKLVTDINSVEPPTKTTLHVAEETESATSIKSRASFLSPERRKGNDPQLQKKRKLCSMPKYRPLNFNSSRTLPEIVAQMKQWSENSPIAKWIDITDGNYTIMENPIYMMIVDDPSSGQIITAKQTVMIVAGIRGRDQHAVSSAMYVLYQLIEMTSLHADLLTKYRFWVIPVFNPDGYDYAMTFPHRRNWAKNLRQNWDISCKDRQSCYHCEAYGLRCSIQPCYGVNLDRNFEYQWIPTEELRSEHACGSLYAGERQLSEMETRAFTRLLHERLPTPYMFIAFKEGDVLGVMYPYSHTKKKRPLDEVLRRRATIAARSAFNIANREYVSGQTSEFLPLFAGGIDDWVDSHLGIDNTYTIMMYRQSDTYNSKLSLERVAQEAYAAMYTLVLETAEIDRMPRVALMMGKPRSGHAITVTASCTLIMLAFTVCASTSSS